MLRKSEVVYMKQGAVAQVGEWTQQYPVFFNGMIIIKSAFYLAVTNNEFSNTYW